MGGGTWDDSHLGPQLQPDSRHQTHSLPKQTAANEKTKQNTPQPTAKVSPEPAVPPESPEEPAGGRDERYFGSSSEWDVRLHIVQGFPDSMTHKERCAAAEKMVEEERDVQRKLQSLEWAADDHDEAKVAGPDGNSIHFLETDTAKLVSRLEFGKEIDSDSPKVEQDSLMAFVKFVRPADPGQVNLL